MKLPFSVDLSDRVVAVTGGAGVLMSEFARALAECGARVAILDINGDAAAAVAREIGERAMSVQTDCLSRESISAARAMSVQTDCLSRESISAARQQIEQCFGRVNYLINGAGGNSPRATTDIESMSAECAEGIKTFFDLDDAGLQQVFDLNITSAFLVTQVFAQGMDEGGLILNISSMNAFRPLTKIPAYSAAKAAVSNFTQWLAVHFAPVGIRVNAIAPGFFVTNQNRALLFDEKGAPSARSEKILAHTPAARFGEPSDLIGTLLWLSCPAASGFVTGTVIPVDGGFAAYSGV